ncbi:hypothetical protein AERO9AM_10747 [Aeromicrobium sp. 9AM]|nr:hypothetical protein AERO9AM_10747 [Aeromicrobium sp. 9AM]
MIVWCTLARAPYDYHHSRLTEQHWSVA